MTCRRLLDHGDFFHGEVFYSLVQLGIIVVIRTVIDYFLGREINELGETDARAG